MESIPRSGIYRIVNSVAGKSYIGSAANIPVRIRNHFSTLRRGCHENIHLQRSYDRNGPESFSWEVLEHCDVGRLVEREQFHIDSTPRSLLYNIRLVAESNHGLKYSDESRAKMSETRKGRRFITDEMIERKAKPFPSFVSPDGIVYPAGKNLSAFCLKHGLNKTHMRLLASGKHEHSKGWTVAGRPYNPKPKAPKTKTKYTPVECSQSQREYPAIVSPSGERFPAGRNLNAFCREHELSAEQMRRAIDGIRGRKHYKGWRVADAT